MGLSTTVTHAIWFFAILAAAGGATDFWFGYAQDAELARDARREIDEERLHARFTDGTFCYNDVTDTVVVQATNTGLVAVNATYATFVVDGQPRSGFVVDNTQKDGSHAWLPDEVAFFNATGVATEPDTVALFTERGVPFFPTKITCRVLTTIVLTPSSASLQVGESVTFDAAGFDQHGAPFDARPFTFTSNVGTVTTIDSDTASLTVGTTSGTFWFRATSGAVTGEASVVVWPGAPVSVTVTPDPASVAAGGTQAFTATVLDAYGNQNDTATVVWTTNAGSITAGGVLTAQTTAQSGRQVTATVGALADSAVVDVVPGPLDHITVTPATVSLKTATTQAFSAVGYDQYENVVTGLTFTWSATRGSVTSGGLYTAPATVGADTVTATAGGKSGQSAVTVTADVHVGTLQTYLNGAPATSFVRGQTVETRVTVVDQAGAVQAGVTVSLEIKRVSGGAIVQNATAVTDAAGIATFTWTTSPTQQIGDHTVKVWNLTGTNFVYVPSADVGNPMTIRITN